MPRGIVTEVRRVKTCRADICLDQRRGSHTSILPFEKHPKSPNSEGFQLLISNLYSLLSNYLLIVASRSGPTPIIFTGTPAASSIILT